MTIAVTLASGCNIFNNRNGYVLGPFDIIPVKESDVYELDTEWKENEVRPNGRPQEAAPRTNDDPLVRRDDGTLSGGNFGERGPNDRVLAFELLYRDVNRYHIKEYLKSKNSIWAEHDYYYIDQVIAAAKDNNINPVLLFAIIGQEQSFVKVGSTFDNLETRLENMKQAMSYSPIRVEFPPGVVIPKVDEITESDLIYMCAQNPWNVYYSWWSAPFASGAEDIFKGKSSGYVYGFATSACNTAKRNLGWRSVGDYFDDEDNPIYFGESGLEDGGQETWWNRPALHWVNNGHPIGGGEYIWFYAKHQQWYIGVTKFFRAIEIAGAYRDL
jgi:hypothetical protein